MASRTGRVRPRGENVEETTDGDDFDVFFAFDQKQRETLFSSSPFGCGGVWRRRKEEELFFCLRDGGSFAKILADRRSKHSRGIGTGEIETEFRREDAQTRDILDAQRFRRSRESVRHSRRRRRARVFERSRRDGGCFGGRRGYDFKRRGTRLGRFGVVARSRRWNETEVMRGRHRFVSRGSRYLLLPGTEIVELQKRLLYEKRILESLVHGKDSLAISFERKTRRGNFARGPAHRSISHRHEKEQQQRRFIRLRADSIFIAIDVERVEIHTKN